jgi:hypothetical protein
VTRTFSTAIIYVEITSILDASTGGLQITFISSHLKIEEGCTPTGHLLSFAEEAIEYGEKYGDPLAGRRLTMFRSDIEEFCERKKFERAEQSIEIPPERWLGTRS